MGSKGCHFFVVFAPLLAVLSYAQTGPSFGTLTPQDGASVPASALIQQGGLTFFAIAGRVTASPSSANISSVTCNGRAGTVTPAQPGVFNFSCQPLANWQTQPVLLTATDSNNVTRAITASYTL